MFILCRIRVPLMPGFLEGEFRYKSIDQCFLAEPNPFHICHVYCHWRTPLDDTLDQERIVSLPCLSSSSASESSGWESTKFLLEHHLSFPMLDPECGPTTPGNKTCPLGACCSGFGFCGLTSEFCTKTVGYNLPWILGWTFYFFSGTKSLVRLNPCSTKSESLFDQS